MRKVPVPRGAPRAAAALAVLAAAACALFYQAPEVRIVGLRVASLGITSGTAELELEITNPNSGDVDVRGFRYRLDVRRPSDEEADDPWTPLGEGYHRTGATLAGGETSRVTVEVPFEYEAVGAAVRAFLREGEVGYRLEGELRIHGGLGEYDVPLRQTGVLSP